MKAMKITNNFRFKVCDLGKFSTAEVAPVTNLIEANCRIHGFTMGKFSLIDLIHGILQKIGKAHVICATWSAGIKDAHQIEWLMSTNLIASFKLLTDHSYKTRQPKYAVSIEELFGVENIRTSEIHAKFLLIHNENYTIIVTSSMNLNANKTCEIFEIEDNKEMFDFYMEFVNHVFGDMPKGFTNDNFTVSKSLDKYFFTEHKQSKLWTEI